MIQELYSKYIFLYVMGGLCLLGTLLKIMVSKTYKRLIKASDNMGSSKHKLIKLMKMKFEACYKLKIGVNNVDSFVDKYVYKHKICGIHLYTWENIGGQLLILCLLVGTVGSVLGLIYKCGKTDILITFFTGVFTSSLLIVVESFINLGAKKSIVKANITDYLENFLKVRLEQETFTPELLDEYRKEYFKSDVLMNNKKERKAELKASNTSKNVEKEKYKETTLQNDFVNESTVNNNENKKNMKKHKVDKHMETASAIETEQPKSKKEREKELLLRERQLSNRSYDRTTYNKNNKDLVSSEPTKEKSVPSYQINDEDDDEDMRFLIKSLMDTVASTDEGTADNIDADAVKNNFSNNKELVEKESQDGLYTGEIRDTKVSPNLDNEATSNSKIHTESEDKIIEDILREFLA